MAKVRRSDILKYVTGDIVCVHDVGYTSRAQAVSKERGAYVMNCFPLNWNYNRNIVSFLGCLSCKIIINSNSDNQKVGHYD